MYNKSKPRSTNNVLPMEINIIFRINTNSFLADRREGTDLDTLSDFIANQLTTCQLREVLNKEYKDGKHLSCSGENEGRKRKKMGGK